MIQTNILMNRDEIIFDPITGDFINKVTGLVLEQDELPESNCAKLSIVQLTPPTIDEFFDHLCDEFAEGLSRARANNWARVIKYPILKVGQTKPYEDSAGDQVNLLQRSYTVRDIDKHGNLTTETTRFTPEPITFFQPDKWLTPNCVEIEGEQINLPIEEEDYSNFFEAMFTLLRRIREAPNRQWINQIPLLVDFLVDNISLSAESGEIGIPEILSSFQQNELQILELEWRVKSRDAEIKKLRKERKQLRSLIYGNHKKH